MMCTGHAPGVLGGVLHGTSLDPVILDGTQITIRGLLHLLAWTLMK